MVNMDTGASKIGACPWLLPAILAVSCAGPLWGCSHHNRCCPQSAPINEPRAEHRSWDCSIPADRENTQDEISDALDRDEPKKGKHNPPRQEPSTNLDRLGQMLEDDDIVVRSKALAESRALGNASRVLLPMIIKLGMDPNERVRHEVVLTLEALYEEEDDASFGMLTHIAMSDGSRINRRAAHRAMGRMIGGPLVELRKAVGDAQRKEQVIKGLVEWGDDRKVELLKASESSAALGTPDDWIEGALLLSQFGSRGEAAALRLLREALSESPDWEDRERAVRIIGGLGAPALHLVEELDSVARDEQERDEVRRAAREALARLRRK